MALEGNLVEAGLLKVLMADSSSAPAGTPVDSTHSLWIEEDHCYLGWLVGPKANPFQHHHDQEHSDLRTRTAAVHTNRRIPKLWSKL